MHLEVKMRRIEPVGVSNGADLLSTTYLLTFSHQDSIKVSIQRIRIFYLALLHKGMANHDDISPRAAEITGQGYHPVPYRVYGITEIGAAPSLPNPILAQMAVRSESAGNAVAVGTRFAHRKIKTVCQTSECRIGVGLCERGDKSYYGRGEQLFAHGGCY